MRQTFGRAFARSGFAASLVVLLAAPALADREVFLLKDINTGTNQSVPSELTELNGEIVFSAFSAANGGELWKTDGTNAGTVLVRDIAVGTGTSSPANLTKVGTQIFFTADDGILGVELWKTDGTTGGTVMGTRHRAWDRRQQP